MTSQIECSYKDSHYFEHTESVGDIHKFRCKRCHRTFTHVIDYTKPKSCDRCGTVEFLKSFQPTDEEPEHNPTFCESCFMSDDVINGECTQTYEEKLDEWNKGVWV